MKFGVVATEKALLLPLSHLMERPKVSTLLSASFVKGWPQTQCVMEGDLESSDLPASTPPKHGVIGAHCCILAPLCNTQVRVSLSSQAFLGSGHSDPLLAASQEDSRSLISAGIRTSVSSVPGDLFASLSSSLPLPYPYMVLWVFFIVLSCVCRVAFGCFQLWDIVNNLSMNIHG